MKYDPDTALARISAADAIVVGQPGQTTGLARPAPKAR